jgi:hypothetical protein
MPPPGGDDSKKGASPSFVDVTGTDSTLKDAGEETREIDKSADNDLHPLQSTLRSDSDEAEINENERNLLEMIRSLDIRPEQVQEALRKMGARHSENASENIQSSEAGSLTVPKTFEGQREVGAVHTQGVAQQPPADMLMGGSFRARTHSYGSANAPNRPVGGFQYPPQQSTGFVMPQYAPYAQQAQQQAAFIQPPQPPSVNINPFNLGAPMHSVQAPPAAPAHQTGAGWQLPTGPPPARQGAPPAGDGQAGLLAQLATLLTMNQHQMGGSDAAILHKISKMEIPKFRGRKDTKSPYEYLKIIKNEAQMANIDPFLIVKHKMPITMVDEAGLWLTFHSEFRSWNQFEVAFNEEYGAVNYIQRLKKELEVRTQGPEEPLTTYIHKISEMCKMIDPYYPEADIIEKILEQMHPEYRQYTRGQHFTSLFALEAYAKRVAQSFYQDKTYKLPPSMEESVEKSFCYNSRSEKSVKFKSGEKTQSTAVSLSALNPQISRERARKRYQGKRENKSDSRNRRFDLNQSDNSSRDNSGSRSSSAHSSKSRASSTGSTSSQKFHTKSAEVRSGSKSPKRKNDKKESKKSKNRPATPKHERKSKN